MVDKFEQKNKTCNYHSKHNYYQKYFYEIMNKNFYGKNSYLSSYYGYTPFYSSAYSNFDIHSVMGTYFGNHIFIIGYSIGN